MSPKFFLDTNVVSEPLGPEPRAAVLQRLRQHEEEIAISSIVWHELRFGVARPAESRTREAIERYLETVVLATMPILDYDRAAAESRRSPECTISLWSRSTTADFKRFRGIRVQSWDR